MTEINYGKIIPICVVVSLLFIVMGTLFKGGEFDVDAISGLEDKIPIIWKILTLGLVVFLAYGIIQKFYYKASMTKKDMAVIIVSGIALWFIWDKFLSTGQISELTKMAAYAMNSVGTLP